MGLTTSTLFAFLRFFGRALMSVGELGAVSPPRAKLFIVKKGIES